MTETTDIKALSNERLLEIKSILSGFEDGYDTVDDKENYEAMRGARLLIDELISLRDQLEAERQRADAAELELIKPLPIGELIQRLEGQTYEKWFSQSYPACEQEPIAYLTRHMGCRSPDDCEEHLEVSDKDGVSGNGEAAIPVFTHPAKPVVVLPKITTERAEWTTWQWIEHLGGRYQNGNPGDYIEFGSVFAVQQMLKQFQRTSMAIMITEIRSILESASIVVKDGE